MKKILKIIILIGVIITLTEGCKTTKKEINEKQYGSITSNVKYVAPSEINQWYMHNNGSFKYEGEYGSSWLT